jgi:hypothetical protein
LKCGGRLNYIVRAGYHSLDSAEWDIFIRSLFFFVILINNHLIY